MVLEIKPLDGDIDLGDFKVSNGTIEQSLRNAYYQTVMRLASAFKILKDGTTVGYFIMKTSLLSTLDEDHTYNAVRLDTICIDEKYQNLHIGTAVLDYIVKQSSEVSDFLGLRCITISAVKERTKWYEKHGFKYVPCDEADEASATAEMYIDFRDESAVERYAEV